MKNLFKALLHRCEISDQSTWNVRRAKVALTPSGVALASSLFVLLGISLRYNLNVAHLVFFVLGLVSTISAFVGAIQLRGLSVKIAEQECVEEGQAIDLKLVLHSESSHNLVEIKTRKRALDGYWLGPVDAKQDTLIHLRLGPLPRGVHELPELVIQTIWPLGIWKIYHLWRPSVPIYVYPSLEVSPPTSFGAAASEQQEQVGLLGQNSMLPDEFKKHDPSEGVRMLAWKVFAKTDGQMLVSRTYDVEHHTHVSLFSLTEAYASGVHGEQALSRLAAWISQAYTKNLTWSLDLGQGVRTGSGSAHFDDCMKSLARIPVQRVN